MQSDPAIDQALYEVLQELGVIEPSRLQLAWTKRTPERTFQDLLLESNLLTDENLGRLLADIYKVPLVEFKTTPIQDQALRLLPETMARSQQLIAYKETETELLVATSNPTNHQALSFVQKKVGKPVVVRFATVRSIKEALNRYKLDLSIAFDKLIADYAHEAETAKNKTQVEPPITKIIDTLFEYAHRSKASDIHIEPEDDQTVIRFRVDGILQEAVVLPLELHDQVVTRIKVLAELRTDEHQAPQDGKLQFEVGDESVDVRVSIVPITNGERVVMRLLSEHSRQLSLEDLGLSAPDLAKVSEAYQRPHGMVLVSGPTGSGKTTSLYAMVKILNTRDINIMTIEDPVEYDIVGINQIQVNKKTGLTFAEGLKSIVRQDPDVILVGEIRDEDTANIAVNSAMTGHLVLSTLHTNDAATAVPRLLDMQIEPFLIASSVNVVVAQRLVRKICLHCRVSKEYRLSQLAEMMAGTAQLQAVENDRSKLAWSLLKKHLGDDEEIRLYQGKGCSVCRDTGYTGRAGIFEVLEVNDAIREAIVNQSDASQIQALAVEAGMTRMIEDGLRKVKAGITTMEEVLRVTQE